MWRNWNPLNPPINEQSSEEENNYESPPENDPNELVSPTRPRQSPSASPRALLRPDPPLVEEVLGEVQQQLRDLSNRQQRADRRDQVRAEAEAARAAAEAVAAANMPDLVEFEVEDVQDGAKASELGRQIKVEFSATDIKFWFAELEAEMTMATIKSQWLRKTVLQRNLPIKQKEDVKSLLTLTQAQAGGNIYQKIKQELVRIYAPKAKDSYCKALTRTMVGLPSQLGNQIVDDVCKKAAKLEGCCCAAAVEALWQLQLPVGIRAHVSNMEFTHQTYKQVFEAADKVHMSSRQVTVAAMASSVAAVSMDETLPAFSTQNQPSEVAAVGGKPPKKNKKNNRNGQSRNANQNSRGKKHDSVPDSQADKMCDRHYRHGSDAWYCVAPQTCPWKDRCTPK